MSLVDMLTHQDRIVPKPARPVERPTLKQSPFTLVSHGLSAEDCEHLAYMERLEFRGHEKEVANLCDLFRAEGDVRHLRRAVDVLEHLIELHDDGGPA